MEDEQVHTYGFIKKEDSMCRFITITFPKTTNFTLASELAKKYGFYWNYVKNKSIEFQIPDDMTYYRATNYACDCDTGLGSIVREDDKWTDIYSRFKIIFPDGQGDFVKALEIETQENRLRKSEDRKRWLNFMKDFLEHTEEKFGILLHDYTSTLEEEHIIIQTNFHVKIHTLTEKFLSELKEDILYIFEV